jgi:hypothetical protein
MAVRVGEVKGERGKERKGEREKGERKDKRG